MQLTIILITALAIIGCFAPRNPNQVNFLGSLISAGAGLIGGLFKSKAQKKANAANSPIGQVAQWEAAGVNPLFGISSGAYIPQQATSIGDSFAIAGGQVAKGLELEHQRDIEETELRKENDELRKEVDKLSKEEQPGYLKQYEGIIPLPRTTEVMTSGTQNYDDPDPNPVLGGDGTFERGDVTVTAAQDAGSGTWVNPRIADAEMSEARYGDLAQEIAGARNLYKDNVYNSRMQEVASQLGSDVASKVHQEYAKGGEETLEEIIDKHKPEVVVYPPYDPGKNPPLRGYYGTPGKPTGF